MKGTEFISAPDVYTADTVVVTDDEKDVMVLTWADREDNLVDPGSGTQATLYINFLKGFLNSATMRIYSSYSADPTVDEWFQETDAIGSLGTITLHNLEITMADSTKCTWHFPIGAVRSLRITVQGTGQYKLDTLDATIAIRTN